MVVLLVDDENLQLLRLESEVKKVFSEDTKILSYQNALKALEENKNNKIDIAFLDIDMPGLNGVDLAKQLKKKNPKINIIFVTAYDNYAFEAYKIHASGYLHKPVSAAKIKEEVDALRYPVEMESTKKIQIKCFGNFEIFSNSIPVKFSYQKTKELFAYLVDREGSEISINELNAVLWEEDHKSYLRNLIADVQQTLKSLGASDVLIKNRNGVAINVKLVDCDAYEYKKGNPNAIRLYRGEYMIQYPWAIFEE